MVAPRHVHENIASTTPQVSMPLEGLRVGGSGRSSSPLNMPVGRPKYSSSFAIRCVDSARIVALPLKRYQTPELLIACATLTLLGRHRETERQRQRHRDSES